MVSTRMPLAKHDSAHSFNIPSCLSFLLTCLLRGMTVVFRVLLLHPFVSTHMPLARHDMNTDEVKEFLEVSTHMPLARHDVDHIFMNGKSISFLLTCLLRGMTEPPNISERCFSVSTHMPLARHDKRSARAAVMHAGFYSHASCEA